MVSYRATQSMVVRGEHGEAEELVAGQSYIHDERHFLLRRYPDLFERVSSRPAKGYRGNGKRPTWTL